MACAGGATLVLLLAMAALAVRGTRGAGGAPPRYSSRIVHTEQGAIRGIIVEPASRRLEPVEVFLGVPYAGRAERLAPPPAAPRWPGTRLADAAPASCPTAPAAPADPHSEDCLQLNIYVPGSGARGEEAPYAVLAWLGAADGAVLAARAHLLVLTVSYRVGLLGFLTSGAADDAATRAGGAGLLDVLAALRWAARNVAAFGGDPTRVTLAARGDHAAHASALLMLPEAEGLVSRVLLLSGSALAPSGLARDAGGARRHVAAALRCEGGEGAALLACVRGAPLAALLAASPPRARFLAAWAPSPPGAPARALHASPTFLRVALALVVCSAESAPYFTDDEIRHGFEEEHRNRILRTFVRNVFRWHRNEIFAAVRNEYTDWEKPIQHPINIRDAALEALSDGAGAAPAARLAQLHARRGAPTYFAHFAHQGRDLDYPQRLGSVAAESEAYFLGQPLVGAGWGGRARNYSRADVAVAEHAVALLASFAKTGAPTLRVPDAPAWPRYELSSQQYLSIGGRVRVRSHYRGHKLALWLHLVPQLHRPGAPPRHHQFRPDRADIFAGDVVPELESSSAPETEDEGEGAEGEEDEGQEGELVEECAPPVSSVPPVPSAPPPGTLATVDAQYYSYTVALGVTVCAGCVLLALNALVFAGIYLQRRPRRPRRPRAAPLAPPRRSTLRRGDAAEEDAGSAGGAGEELAERPAPPAKKRVQIQEISV